MSGIAVVLGMVIIIASIFSNAFAGTQIALIGVGFILIGIYLEVKKSGAG